MIVTCPRVRPVFVVILIRSKYFVDFFKDLARETSHYLHSGQHTEKQSRRPVEHCFTNKATHFPKSYCTTPPCRSAGCDTTISPSRMSDCGLGIPPPIPTISPNLSPVKVACCSLSYLTYYALLEGGKPDGKFWIPTLA